MCSVPGWAPYPPVLRKHCLQADAAFHGGTAQPSFQPLVAHAASGPVLLCGLLVVRMDLELVADLSMSHCTANLLIQPQLAARLTLTPGGYADHVVAGTQVQV